MLHPLRSCRLLASIGLAAVLSAGLAAAAPAGLAATGTSAPSSVEQPTIHLSPDGDDAATGGPDDPVRSLARAERLLRGIDSTSATIVITPGTYYEDSVVSWNAVPQEELVLRSTSETERPVFDGSQATGGLHYWMNTAGGPRLDVRGLLVRNYRTGGIRLDTDGNRVHDTIFERLGNQHVPDGPGYSALHLLGSSHNTFSDNVFRDLENSDCPGCIHAVYAANGSSDNRVVDNEIARVTGDPVRLRNDTHRNVIEGNTFSRSGTNIAHRAMVSFWRFTADEECGSDNRVDHNRYDGRFYNGDSGQRIIGSGSSDGVPRCAQAVRGKGNIVDPAP